MSEDAVGLVVVIACDLFVALAIWGTTRAAASEKLALNGFAGIRTGPTMRDHSAWVAAHRAALPIATKLALAVLACAVVAAVVAVAGHPQAAFFVAFGGMMAVLLGVIPLVKVANRAAREAPPS